MDTNIIDGWMDLYEEIWRTESTDRLKEIFTEDATYKPGPYEPTIEGLDDLAVFWKDRIDPGEQFAMEHEIVALEGDVAVVRVHVDYSKPKEEWKDLWIVQLDDDGRCFSFEEWPFKPR